MIRLLFSSALLSCALILGNLPVAQAQDEAFGNVLGLSLEDLMNVEVVSASKKPTRIGDTPAMVQVISRDEIERYGYRNIAEALQRTLGIYVSNDRNYEYAGIRGFSRPGDFNTRVLVLIDGHRINDPIYDEGAIGNHLPIDIEAVERIEVIKGPGSAVWGTNALLAVVNIFTKKASDLGDLVAGGDVGSNLRRKGYLQFGHADKEGLSIAGAVSALNSRGEEEIYFPEYDTPDSNNGISRNNDDESYRHAYLSAQYGEFSLLAMSGERRKTISTGSYGTIFGTDDQHTVDDSTRAELTYDHDFSAAHEGNLVVRASYDVIHYHGLYPYSDQSDAPTKYRDYSYGRQFAGEARVRGNALPWLGLVGGIEYHKNFDLKNGAATIEPELVPDGSTENDFWFGALFANASAKLSEEFALEAGARFDHYSTFGSNLSPRVGLVYRPCDETSLKASYGRAFRAPNDYELHYQASAFLPNPDLSPEEIENLELIWEQKLDRRIQISTSLFYYELSDLISQTTTPLDQLQFINNGDVTARGIEVETTSHLEGGINAFLGGTYVEAVDEDSDQQITNSPHFLAHAGVSIPLVDQKLFISPEFRFLSSRQTLQGNRISSTPLFNVTFLARKLVTDVDLSFSIYNLFDHDIENPGGNEHIQDKLPSVGRELRLALAWHF